MASPLRVLIDLNPVLDVFEDRELLVTTSSLVLAAAENGLIRGYLAAHSITTLYYLVAKSQSGAIARAAIGELLGFITVAPVDQRTIESALLLNVTDFEDAVQIAAATGVGADYIVTRNVSDFRRSPVKALLPDELLTLL